MLLLGQRNIRRVKAQVVANSLSKNEVMLLKLMSEFHACTLMFLNNYLQRNPESYFWIRFCHGPSRWKGVRAGTGYTVRT